MIKALPPKKLIVQNVPASPKSVIECHCPRGGGEKAQWANSGGEVSITLLTSITSANTPQSSQKKLPPPNTNALPPTTKPPTPTPKSQ